jgi:hypothetical protein
MSYRPKKKCAHCEAEIDHLKYSCWERRNCYGTCDVNFGNQYEDDSEYDDGGDWSYKCPECENEVSESELLEIEPPVEQPVDIFQQQPSTWVV